MKRKPHTPQEKAALVLETFRGEKTINEIASVNEIHPNMLSRWKREAETNLFLLFENDSAKKRKEQKRTGSYTARTLCKNRKAYYSG